MNRTQPATGRVATIPDGSTPLDHLVREVTPQALDWIGATEVAAALAAMGPLDDPGTQHEVVRWLGTGILAADASAVQSAEDAVHDLAPAARARVIASLGATSSAAADELDRSLAPLVRRAARQSHVSLDLIETARATIGRRQAEADFVHWVTVDPDGFGAFAHAAALRAAGARVWDRSWARLTAGLDATRHNRHPQADRLGHGDPSVLEAAVRTARTAAIDSLVDTASSSDAAVRHRAWQAAIERADGTPGTVPWSCALQRMRAEMGLTTWRTTNRLIADHVAVIVNDLTWIAGFVAMISLAAEATVTATRTVAVCAGTPAPSGTTDDFADSA